ncbi:MAG: glycosyltransferase [Actinobacteria bacterium]|nr:glycosyltransferase [Actinomycetota bacterium]
MRRILRTTVLASAFMGVALAVGTVRNCRAMPSVLPDLAAPLAGKPNQQSRPTVALLLPARDEQANIAAALTSLLTQDSVDQIIVLDDDSTDGTASIAARLLESDPRGTLLRSKEPPPPGWLGKPWACQRLSDATTADVLVFVDADVVLHRGAVAAATQMLIDDDLAMLCPYPKQQTTTALTRLVQPLLQWSWLTFIPYRYSMTAQPPSMAVGNGQFALFRSEQYRAIGGHSAVAEEIVEDVAMARALRSSGSRTAVVDGQYVATCRMYTTNAELIDGYTKSLWQAFGGPVQQVGTLGLLKLLYLLPAIALGSRDKLTRGYGAVAISAAIVGRIVVGRRTGQRVFPDVGAAPASIAALIGLTAVSDYRRARGDLTWKGRRV